ncbi:MAG: alpha-amylase family glycosyl hydrolase [Anaerolineae bacterium]
MADFWLEDMGADGFRMDAVKYYVEADRILQNSPDNFIWLESLNSHLKTVAPDSFTVGEAYGSTFESRLYVNKQSVDIAFDFDLARAFINSANSGNNQAVIATQDSVLGYYPYGQYGVFLTNHDQKRVMNEFGENIELAKVATSMMLTNPGVPFLYYGEEIGMIGDKPDECIRIPMQWDSVTLEETFTLGKHCDNNTNRFNVKAEASDPQSLLSYYRDLIYLRNKHNVLQTGEFRKVLSSSSEVYSFVRFDSNELLLVVINLSADAVSDYALSLDQSPYANARSHQILFGNGSVMDLQMNISGGFENYVPFVTLPPHSTTIIAFN